MKKLNFLLTLFFLCMLGLFLGPTFSQAEQKLEECSTINDISLNPNQKIKKIEFVEPVRKGWIVSGFGWRTNPLTGNKEFNKGLDIAASKGTEVYAAAEGRVVSAVSDYEPRSYYGKYILIMHSDKIKTHYSKLDSVLVKKNQTVKAGELIGRVGRTGIARGPHLHFEIYVDDEAQNPEEYIDFKLVSPIKIEPIPKTVEMKQD